MTKQRISSSRQRPKRSKRSRAGPGFDHDRVALWLSIILIALLNVIFLAAWMQQDTGLMEKILGVLITALKLALERAFNETGKKSRKF